MLKLILGLAAIWAGIGWTRKKEFSFGNDSDPEPSFRVEGRVAIAIGIASILCGVFLLLLALVEFAHS